MTALESIAAIRSRISEIESRFPAAGRSTTITASGGSSFASVLAAQGNTGVDLSGTGPLVGPEAGRSTVPADTPFAELFNKTGAERGISPRLLAAVARVESGFNPNATSPAGAQGLMQFMPSTSVGMGVNPFDPASAIDGAARLLVGNYEKYGSIEKALASYNVGPGTLARIGGLGGAEDYVNKVLSQLGAR